MKPTPAIKLRNQNTNNNSDTALLMKQRNRLFPLWQKKQTRTKYTYAAKRTERKTAQAQQPLRQTK